MEPQNDMERKLAELGGMIASGPSIVDQAAKRIAENSVAPRPRAHWSTRYRSVALAMCLLVCVGAVGLAATETGHNLIRWILTPVEKLHTVKWQGPVTTTTENGKTVTQSIGASVSSNRPEPFSDDEAKKIRAQMQEVHEIATTGGGRLAGLIEGLGPDGKYFVVYRIEYMLSNGEVQKVSSIPYPGKQAENMRVDGIMQLRDSGAGEVISFKDLPIGLGQYTIRFTLSDGQTVDLETYYPPGTRQEREAIFAETRQLKQQKQFSVYNAFAGPGGRVAAVLRYKLADGRTVGMTELDIPADWVSPDGKYLITPESQPVEIQNAAKR